MCEFDLILDLLPKYFIIGVTHEDENIRVFLD